ncbi:Imm1 family immunity protein [Prauserella sediminis]|uniref:Imm1 family immunity protein n=1 Tax=Prauserella sediminis TaxID=577680 RepID=UPI00389B1BF9
MAAVLPPRQRHRAPARRVEMPIVDVRRAAREYLTIGQRPTATLPWVAATPGANPCPSRCGFESHRAHSTERTRRRPG